MAGDEKLSELDARLEKLGRKTREGFANRAAELREAAERLSAGDADAREAIQRLAHKLRGVAGSVGRPELTERAARLEVAAKTDAAAMAIAEGARRLAAAAETAEPPAKSPPRAPKDAPKATALGWRVIALDDESSTRRLLEITLRQAGGCSARVFESPSEAMQAVRDEVPDLVIVDAMMPDVSGLAFYAGVRRRSATVPVVILSAASPDELGWELPDDPRLKWMRKPFRPGRLIADLRAFVEAQ